MRKRSQLIETSSTAGAESWVSWENGLNGRVCSWLSKHKEKETLNCGPKASVNGGLKRQRKSQRLRLGNHFVRNPQPDLKQNQNKKKSGRRKKAQLAKSRTPQTQDSRLQT